jgi:hypothetical protein
MATIPDRHGWEAVGIAPARHRAHDAAILQGTIARMTDYASLIDAEIWAFIRATEAAYPADTASHSIAEQRAIYDRMCQVFLRGYPPGVTATDRSFAGVPCRVYAGRGATVIYAHGGGYVVGGCTAMTKSAPKSAPAPGLP